MRSCSPRVASGAWRQSPWTGQWPLHSRAVSTAVVPAVFAGRSGARVLNARPSRRGPATGAPSEVARLAGLSLPALLADQPNGGVLAEELEGEGLHVANLWIEQVQRSAALVEQVCCAEQSAHGRRGEELHPGQVYRRCARGHGGAHDHIEPIDAAGFDLA